MPACSRTTGSAATMRVIGFPRLAADDVMEEDIGGVARSINGGTLLMTLMLLLLLLLEVARTASLQLQGSKGCAEPKMEK